MQYQIKQLQTQSESSAFIMEEGVGESMFDMISNYMIKIKKVRMNKEIFRTCFIALEQVSLFEQVKYLIVELQDL